MEKRERKIGEVFEIYDCTKLKVIASDTCSCEGCYFHKPDNYDCSGTYLSEVTGLCSQARSDGQDVIFAKIEGFKLWKMDS